MVHSQKPPDSSQSAPETEVQKAFEEIFQKSLEEEPWKGAGLYGAYLSSPGDIRRSFLDLWPHLDGILECQIGAERALLDVGDLVVYDIPDGTRTTLTTTDDIDVELEAGMWCLSFVHTLRSLGARKAVVMTHTAYNRDRGKAERDRIMTVVERGIAPMADYCASNNVNARLVGMSEDYELSESLKAAFPERKDADFEVFFLVDYREECFLEDRGRELMSQIPDVDVVVRHTKMHISGGWLPTRTLRSTYLYSQNGTVYTNWTYDEHVSLVGTALLAKHLNRGEMLDKTYPCVDEVKKRYQKRELGLSNRVVRVRQNPKKLYVMGSPWGLVQVYY
jgi:hypothetical protein